MRITWRRILALLCYFAGILGWCYVGAYMILSRPVWGILRAFHARQLNILTLLGAAVQVFVYLSLAGAVWCIGYMLSDHLKDKDKEMEGRRRM